MSIKLDLLTSCIGAAILLFHCGVIGIAILGRLRPTWPPAKPDVIADVVLVMALSVGLVVDILALLALGLTDHLTPAGIGATGVGLLCLAAILLRHVPLSLREALAGFKWPSAVIAVALFAATALTAVHPPGSWDDTMYHLPIARAYLEHGGIVTLPFIRFPLFPQNIELLIALGLMTGHDLGAQLFAQLPLYLMALSLIATSRLFFGTLVPGALAILLMVKLVPMQIILGFAYVDAGLGFFCWMAVLALALRLEANETSTDFAWPIIAGLMAGAAIGTKYFGIPLAGILGLWLLVIRRDWKASLVFGLTALAVGGAWYFRSFIVSGDPIHPGGGNIFGFYLWDAADLAGQKKELSTHGVPPSTLDFVGALKAAGALPLLLAFASLLVHGMRPGLRLLRFVFCSYFLFWFFVVQVERYLIPIIAAGSLLSVIIFLFLDWPPALRHAWYRVPEYGKAAFAGLVGISALAYFVDDVWPNVKLTTAAWSEEIEKRPGYALLSKANELRSSFGDRLVQVGFENGFYFFRGTTIGDWFGPGRYSQMMLFDPLRMKKIMQGFDARMLAVNTAHFKFDRSAYEHDFDVVMSTSDGVLLTLRPDSAPSDAENYMRKLSPR
ncbi:MAG: hypothetical protein ACLQL2_01440 [Methylovirgula sp.]